MNWDTMKADWKRFRGEIKERWGRLTDDDLDIIDGKKDQMIAILQKRYAIERQEAEKQLNEYMESRRESEVYSKR